MCQKENKRWTSIVGLSLGDSFSHRIKLKLIAGLHYGQWVESSATPYQSPHIRRRRSVHHEHTVSGQPQTRLLRATIQNIIYSIGTNRDDWTFVCCFFFLETFSPRLCQFLSAWQQRRQQSNSYIHPSIYPHGVSITCVLGGGPVITLVGEPSHG